MAHLVAVSLLWAFSFGLIKGHLAGMDAGLVSAVRLAISLVVFLPALRTGGLTRRQAAALAGIGLVQYGLMYLFYLASFRDLQAYEVALFTVFTPLWVALLDDAHRRRFTARHHLAAALAVAGTAVVVYRGLGRPDLLRGFALVQLSNACFALGQVLYRDLRPRLAVASDRSLFALLYAGGLLAALPVAALGWDGALLDARPDQLAVLLYLGAVASGLGFYFWNLGATRVGAGALAVMNNAKVPLGVAVSLLVFGERTDLARLLAGGAVMALALVLAEPRRTAPRRA